MPTKINPNYKPSNRVAELLAIRFGLTVERAAEFIGHELPAFMMYWEGTGKPKSNWDSTCLNWMDRNYESKKEAMDRNHQRSPQGDVFDNALKRVQGEEEEKPKRSAYRFIPSEPSNETMTAEEAFEAFHKMSGVRL
jgi:hypothetical protein